MDRKKVLANTGAENLFNSLGDLYKELDDAFINQFDRSLPFTDSLLDRWDRAKKLGFGEGSSIYDSSFVFGKVKVGVNTWIGPFTIIDGSGNLSIGNNCTISAGVHIYTHDNVGRTITGGKIPIMHDPVEIGDCTYIAPQVVIQKGVRIGKHCIIGANSFVNSSIPDFSVAVGSPAKITGRVVIENDHFSIEYFKKETL
ncbi:MAG: acyltransferase [Bacteroidetes bacterium]|nr:acyltransferase [Bacteroidota bacterium]MBS1930868.1 acyltransferase [Bacteroidota bacterium]